MVTLQQVQILSHQNKIATRVELFVGVGSSDYLSASFSRLGSVSGARRHRCRHCCCAVGDAADVVAVVIVVVIFFVRLTVAVIGVRVVASSTKSGM
jgi:hypothetical protein